MKEINENFGIAEEDFYEKGNSANDIVLMGNNKRVGRIVKQLHDRYETYGK